MEIIGIIIPIIMGIWLISAVHKGSYGRLEEDEKEQEREHRRKMDEHRRKMDEEKKLEEELEFVKKREESLLTGDELVELRNTLYKLFYKYKIVPAIHQYSTVLNYIKNGNIEYMDLPMGMRTRMNWEQFCEVISYQRRKKEKEDNEYKRKEFND